MTTAPPAAPNSRISPSPRSADASHGRRRWKSTAIVAAGVATITLLGVGALASPVRSLLEAGSHDTAVTTPATDPAPAPIASSSVAMPVGNLPGWKQTFADDFTGSALDGNWVSYDGQPQNDPGGYFSSSQVSVGNGVLNIAGTPDPSRRGLYTTGGVSNRPVFSQTYGKYEIRFRMDRGTGLSYALLLWPTSNQTQAEIDIAEDNGHGRDVAYATMHSADGTANVEREISGDFTTWHTLGVEWSPQKLVFTMDGQPWDSIEGAGVPSVPMSVALQSQAWYCGNSWQACPDASTPKQVNLQVDWVVAYQEDDR